MQRRSTSDEPRGAREAEAASRRPELGVSQTAALTQLRAYIADRGFGEGDRLPAERMLGPELGLTRFELRKALSTLVAEGVLWRNVGKGTFLSTKWDQSAQNDLEKLARRVSLADVIRARGALEPAIAREAAAHATEPDVEALQLNARRIREAQSWRAYETLDNDFHRLVAEASGSLSLLALFDQLNALRRTVSWGRLERLGSRPPADHPSFAEHDRIVAALADRDPDEAQGAMRSHLRSVEHRLFR